MSLEEKIDFNGKLAIQEKNNLKVDILNKMNELILSGINKAVEESGLKLGKGFSLVEHLADYEKGIIQYALEITQYNQLLASQLLGIKYTTLNNKIKRYQLLNKNELLKMTVAQ